MRKGEEQMEDISVQNMREKTEEADYNNILKSSLGGYTKKSVREYLSMINSQNTRLKENCSEEIRKIAADKDAVAEELAAVQALLEEKKTEVFSLKTELDNTRIEIEELKKENEALEKEVTVLEEEKNALEKEILDSIKEFIAWSGRKEEKEEREDPDGDRPGETEEKYPEMEAAPEEEEETEVEIEEEAEPEIDTVERRLMMLEREISEIRSGLNKRDTDNKHCGKRRICTWAADIFGREKKVQSR